VPSLASATDRAALPLDDPDRLAAVAAVAPAAAESAARFARLVQRARITSDAEAAWLVLTDADTQRVLAADGEAPAPAGARLPGADTPAARAVRRGVVAFDRDDEARAAIPVADRDGFTVGALVVARSVRRPWRPEEAAALAGLAEWAATELELVRENRERAGAEAASREVLATASDLVLELGDDGRVLALNPAAADIVGAAGGWVAQSVAPEYGTVWAEAFVRCAEQREVADVEIVLLRPDGRRVLVRGRLRSRPVDAPQVAVRAILRDVTAERRVRDERERVLATLEATTDVVAVMDVHARLTWLNASGRRLVGLPRDADVAGLPLARLYAAGAWAGIEADGIPQAIARGTWAGETVLCAADGRDVPASQVIIAHASSRGGVWFLSTILRDITDRKRVEDDLREREARFRRLADASRDGVVVVEDGRIAEANVAAERLFGVGELGLAGLPVVECFATDARARVTEVLSRGLDGTVEVAGWRRGGGEIDLELTASPITVDGRPAQVLVLRDISGIREVERLKRDFVATVSHELRTPLTSVRGALALVAAKPEVAALPDAAPLLKIAADNLDRLTRLIGDILDLEKLDAGGAPLKLASLPAAELLTTTADSLRPMAAGLAVPIAVDAPDTLLVLGDRDRLLQVLTNLVSNALRFSPAGVPVVLRARDGGSIVRFDVEDRGPGIPARDVPRLFGRFTQLDNVGKARVQGGSGLGLAISRSIVEQHRGRIGVESRPGERTVFWFEVPAVPRTSGELALPTS
jgi:PAS domain S-box-containing protein